MHIAGAIRNITERYENNRCFSIRISEPKNQIKYKITKRLEKIKKSAF